MLFMMLYFVALGAVWWGLQEFTRRKPPRPVWLILEVPGVSGGLCPNCERDVPAPVLAELKARRRQGRTCLAVCRCGAVLEPRPAPARRTP